MTVFGINLTILLLKEKLIANLSTMKKYNKNT